MVVGMVLALSINNDNLRGISFNESVIHRFLC